MAIAKKLLASGKKTMGRVVEVGVVASPGTMGGGGFALTYEFSDDSGKLVRNVIALQYVPAIDKLQAGDTLAVVYQPEKSSNNYPEAYLQYAATEKPWDKLLLKLFLILVVVISGLIILAK